MGTPAPVPDIPVYEGDPLNIVLTFEAMNLTSFDHVAMVRHRRGDAEVLAEFDVDVVLVDTDTQISLHLDGDSELGVQDGITRNLGREAYWDIQQYVSNGEAGDTLLTGKRVITADVSR